MVLRWEGPLTWARRDKILTIAVLRIVVDVQLTTKTVMIFIIMRNLNGCKFVRYVG